MTNYDLWRAEQALLNVRDRSCLACMGNGNIGSQRCPTCGGSKVYSTSTSSDAISRWWQMDTKFSRQQLIKGEQYVRPSGKERKISND